MIQPSVKRPDTLTVSHVGDLQLVETTNSSMYVYLRHSTYGVNTLSFNLYPDSFYTNVIQNLANHYMSVEVTRFQVYYQPALQFSGSLFGLPPTQVMITQESSLSLTNDFKGFGSMSYHQLDKPFSISFSPSQKSKEMGYPHRLFPASKLNSASTANYDAPWTIGMLFPDYIGNQPGAYSTPKGSIRIVTTYVFRTLVQS